MTIRYKSGSTEHESPLDKKYATAQGLIDHVRAKEGNTSTQELLVVRRLDYDSNYVVLDPSTKLSISEKYIVGDTDGDLPMAKFFSLVRSDVQVDEQDRHSFLADARVDPDSRKSIQLLVAAKDIEGATQLFLKKQAHVGSASKKMIGNKTGFTFAREIKGGQASTAVFRVLHSATGSTGCAKVFVKSMAETARLEYRVMQEVTQLCESRCLAKPIKLSVDSKRSILFMSWAGMAISSLDSVPTYLLGLFAFSVACALEATHRPGTPTTMCAPQTFALRRHRRHSQQLQSLSISVRLLPSTRPQTPWKR